MIVACVLLLSLSFLSATAGAESTVQSYIINLEGRRQPIPLCYSVVKTYSYFNLAVDTLSAPTDIFIDDKDILYILDAGNDRIIKLSPDGEVMKEYVPEGNDKLSNPNGIYVDADENMYIADTDNSRVIVFDRDGKAIKQFIQPDSLLYDAAYPFRPIKIYVDNLGQLYVINDLDYHGFTILDADNNFKGYLGAARLSASLTEKIINMIASQAQKDQLGKRVPPMHTNFTITPDGSIYTTTANVSSEQLKRFSPVGNNFYPNKGAFGDLTTDYLMTKFGKEMKQPKFVDVCVDDNDIVSIIDNLSGRIYQYDQDGLMIASFGGTGNWEGRFMNAVAMNIDSQGQLYVLDQNLGTIQVFKPTKFIDTVNEALGLYNNGKYSEAQVLWKDILTIDSAYPIAHIGVGKAELKQKNYYTAMVEYKKAGNKYGYSQAYVLYLRTLVQKYFIGVVAGICALVGAIYVIVSKLYRKSKILSGVRSYERD
jgi:sugar lactone lactonase YvrE